MKKISEAAIDAEHSALDKIHEVLNRPDYRTNGITAEALSQETGLAIGRIREVLRASECVVKRIRGSMRYRADWSDLEGFMEQPRRAASKLSIAA
jgi:ABC-type ATPase with predicted acetyltransferase domain